MLRGAMGVGEGVELVDEALGMNPAQAVLAELELTGIVADDDRVGQQAVGLDAAPECGFSGDLHRIGGDLERGEAELFKMGLPCRAIGEVLVVVFGELADQRPGERAVAHIGERLGVDDVVAMAGTQQVEEVEPALRTGGAEPGEAVIADLRAEAILGLVPGTGVVDADCQLALWREIRD